MKSGTFTNNTSFTASAAQVNVPTNSVDFLFRGEFIIPAAIRVVKARLYGVSDYNEHVDITKFVAVTPGKSINSKESTHMNIRKSRPKNFMAFQPYGISRVM